MAEQAGEGIEYPESFIAYIQAMWGEGFLSPGGPPEVAKILEGESIAGCRVLDIGCGIGGCDLELLRNHGAGSLVGIDVEPQLIAHSRELARRHGLEERMECRLVEPGPLPFEAADFDIVFSKDAMVHIPEKSGLYRDVLRVLRPGGLFLASDWLRGWVGGNSPTMDAWMATAGLHFEMETPQNTKAAMELAGFTDVAVRNRNRWFRDQTRRDLAQLEGPARRKLVEALGAEGAEAMLHRTRLRIEIVDSGELSPCHLKGRKPG